jgi:hypothetical protein
MEVAMKTKKFVYIIILIFFLTSVVLAEDQKKGISVDEALNYYCHTWINPDYYESPNKTGIKKFNKDGTFKSFSNEINENKEFPSWYGKFIIEKSWIDKDGSVWINVKFNFMGYDHLYTAKISDNGNTLEQLYSYTYPTEIDPNHRNLQLINVLVCF